ncbi:MAG TPA: class I SAM-dependent methyltransferase [Kineosporiaceae bacterium]|jgi:predicted O-methyltransferase YrrM|nr:class I SAM-dependent methyltransferase [Kineosporiaceae bacterium]
MARGGTDAHAALVDLPPLVACAVAAAKGVGFGLSCLPSQGRLLRVLAGGVGDGRIGETGTGAGVGLAWLASGAAPGARLVSVERDAGLARVAGAVFEDQPAVEVLEGDWQDLQRHGPFDLLVLDGGGQGKGEEPPLRPELWLRPGGLVVLDDFTPSTGWPPLFDGRPDAARLHWLEHPRLSATQVRTQPDAATILAVLKH